MSNSVSVTPVENLLSDSKGSLSWMLQGKAWKSGSKLPVGWFLTQWMQSEARQRANEVGIEKSFQTRAGENYQFSITLPKDIPAGAHFSVAWRGKTIASVSGAGARSGQGMSFSLAGSGGMDQLQLITSSNVDFGELRGVGFWKAPAHITQPLASEVSAKVGQGGRPFERTARERHYPLQYIPQNRRYCSS